MERRLTYKVPGGKMVRVRTRATETILQSVAITGDFFLHPEEAIELLEESLSNFPLSDIDERIDDFFAGVEAFGIDSDSMKKALHDCIDGGVVLEK